MLTLGVDAHKQVHAAVALDDAGRDVGRWRGANSPAGWEELRCWASGLTDPERCFRLLQLREAPTSVLVTSCAMYRGTTLTGRVPNRGEARTGQRRSGRQGLDGC